MDPSTRAVLPLRRRMIEDMRLRKMQARTQGAYIRGVRRLARFLGARMRSRPRICGGSSGTWSTQSPRRSRSTPPSWGCRPSSKSPSVASR